MELFRLFGTIALDNSEANQGIDETTDKAQKAHPKISAAFEKIGTAAVKVGKVVASGLAVGATAIGALAKQSLESYAEYEQLVGGAELMFGEGFDFIAERAKTAYKDVQMSQNEYLTQVNGFAVGLKTALGGNEQAAAELSAKIIKAEADIIAATGNSQEAVQNAFNGIMKSNFTMLDNLGLGITPTKEGFQEVIDKVNEWNAANGNATYYMIDNLADCQAALVDYVEMQGMADYAANESAKTLQGSLASMKAAWKNLLSGFADDSQDLGELVKNLADSATTAVRNIVPRIQQILSGISTALPQVMSVIATELPVLMESLLPGLIDGAIALMTGLIAMLPQILQILITQIPYIVSQIANAAVSAFPVLLQTVKELFGQIWDYISLELLNTGVSFEDAFAKIRQVVENAWMVLQTVWNTVGQPIFDLIQNCVGIVRDAFSERMPEIQGFVSQCFEDISNFWNNNLKPCLDAIKGFIENTLAPAFQAVFEGVVGKVIDDVFGTIVDLWNNTLKPVFTGITDFLTGVFTGNWEQAWNGIKNIFEGIWEGIKTAFKLPINWIIDGINAFIRGINKIKIPDWVPVVGGKGFHINEIPRLEQGGILEKGQVGLLEGNGAEAVVPLDQNQAWINAVARDMKAAGIGGQSEVLTHYFQQLLDMLADYFPQLLNAAGHDIVTNDGVIVAHYAPMLNSELGKISSRKGRGR